jgi:hypothetical protein
MGPYSGQRHLEHGGRRTQKRYIGIYHLGEAKLKEPLKDFFTKADIQPGQLHLLFLKTYYYKSGNINV